MVPALGGSTGVTEEEEEVAGGSAENGMLVGG